MYKRIIRSYNVTNKNDHDRNVEIPPSLNRKRAWNGIYGIYYPYMVFIIPFDSKVCVVVIHYRIIIWSDPHGRSPGDSPIDRESFCKWESKRMKINIYTYTCVYVYMYIHCINVCITGCYSASYKRTYILFTIMNDE